MSRRGCLSFSGLLVVCLSGCAPQYRAVVRPVARFNSLSPELENLTDAAIDTYLKANVKVAFPTVLAVAKLSPPYRWSEEFGADYLKGAEAEGWQALTSVRDGAGEALVSQVQLVSPMLCPGKPTLKGLRDAAALLHAPVLLVYVQVDDARDGQNEAAMAYWTVVGLFTVPGNTVGRYSVCQALLIDTQSGFILATAQGEAKREENVLAGAVDTPARRATARRSG